MLLESNDLKLWATKFNEDYGNYDDAARVFQSIDVRILLKTVYQQKCATSLESLYHTHRY